MEKNDTNLVNHYDTLGDFKKDFRNINLYHLVASLVTGHTVVDIGCGAALFASILKEQGKDVVGIEPSNDMRILAKKIDSEIKVIEGSAEDIEALIKTPVDSITMLDVLEHVKEDGQQVKKIYNTLTDSGRFVVVVPSHPFLFGERDKQMNHYRRYTKESLDKVLTSNGFEVETIRHWNALGFLPYAISEKIFRKPLHLKLRESGNDGLLYRLIRKLINQWFKYIENNIDFRFGLSIVAVAKKMSHG